MASSFFVYMREVLRNPRTMGSVCPSSRGLGYAMAREVLGHSEGLIVELGAGTGSITAQLLRAGVPADKLLAIERSEKLVTHLKERFPDIRVVQGDAAKLRDVPEITEAGVAAVVSGLPLRSLPKDIVDAITEEVSAVLSDGGVFVQFTYAIFSRSSFMPDTFKRIPARVVLFNIPPARVDVFERLPREEAKMKD